MSGVTATVHCQVESIRVHGGLVGGGDRDGGGNCFCVCVVIVSFRKACLAL